MEITAKRRCRDFEIEGVDWFVAVIHRGLSETGYVEGAVEYRWRDR